MLLAYPSGGKNSCCFGVYSYNEKTLLFCMLKCYKMAWIRDYFYVSPTD